MIDYFWRKLLNARNLTLEQIRAQDPELADLVDGFMKRDTSAQIMAAVRQLPPDIRPQLEAIDFGAVAGHAFDYLRVKMTELGVAQGDIDQTVARARAMAPPLSPQEPIANYPGIAQQLAHAGVYEVATIAGLGGAAAQALAEAAPGLGAVNNTALATLVTERILTDEQARAVGVSAALYHLVDCHTEVATAIMSTPFTALGNKPPASMADLARLTPDDWTRFLASLVSLPGDAGPDTFGTVLAARFSTINPGAALVARLPVVDARQLSDDAGALATLLRNNPSVAGATFDRVDAHGIDPTQLTQIEQAHARLVKIVRAYPGLALAAVLDDPNLSPDVKAQIVQRRVDLVHKACEHLGDAAVVHLNLSDGNDDLAKLGLDSLGASVSEQAMVVATLRSFKRVWAITQSVDDMHALVQQGYTSAISVGREHFDLFSRTSGLEASKAKRVWSDARVSMAGVAMTAASTIDVVHGLFDHMAVSNQPPSIQASLKNLPGFQDLFGNLSFCDCQECASILGPAAYFVDLMHFIDENVMQQAIGSLPIHKPDLMKRRPDLWTLELSCDNTIQRIPMLDIVDEILENYSATQTLGYRGSLTDRGAIETLVYKNTLSTRVDSFSQPFHLPLARIRAYMTKFEHTRGDIADAFGASPEARAQAELDLSQRQMGLITTADPDLAHMIRMYGIVFSGTAVAVDRVDAAVLGAAMGLTHAELGQLIATVFVAAGGASISIMAEKRDPTSVQNDVEWVTGLTADALDRMHRFTRLLPRTGWTIPELDTALSTLHDSALSSLHPIAQLHAVQIRLGITVVEACALIGDVPQVPVGASLFDRLFNGPSFVAADQRFPQPLTRFIHPAFRQTTSAPADPTLSRLLSGLSVDLDRLASLARHLAGHLAQEVAPSFDPNAANDADRYFVLSMANLTLLYHHARLAALLSLSIDDLFQLLGFLALDQVSGLPDLLALLDLRVWWHQSGYRLDDIAIATGQPPRDGSRYPDATAVARQAVAAAAAALTFTATLFAVALGTTETGSHDLITNNLHDPITNNPTLIEATHDGTWRLVSGVDLDTAAITIPPSAIVPEPPDGYRMVVPAEVRDALRPFLAREVLVRSLGTALDLSTDKIVALAALVGQSLTSDSIVKAVRGDGAIAPLLALVSAMIPMMVALPGSPWDAMAIAFVGQHNGLFGTTNEPLPHMVPDPPPPPERLHPNAPFVSLAQLRAFSTYTRLKQRQLIGTPDAGTVDAADLRAVLTDFDDHTQQFPSVSDAAMARVLGVAAGLVVGLRGPVTLPAVATLALEQLDRAAQLAATLNLDGETLASLVNDDDDLARYDALSHAADALYAVLGARYTDEGVRTAKLDEAEQPVREAKRDALTNYLIRSVADTQWATLDDLYQYFLIDIEAGGCSSTSRVVAATMSAQLYVYRVIMNLELVKGAGADTTYYKMTLSPDAAAEWEWRKNFRVWQANRKVFLWPENYLDPDLRDDKTPLFKDLEKELLQTDIDDQNVLNAYTKYLAGFEEVASLTIAGAYHDRSRLSEGSQGSVGDVLHLFGVNSGEPPTYYYRTCENLIASGRNPDIAAVWSPWTKITVQITGRRVAPVVHRGRLHVFWLDVHTRPANSIASGTSQFTGYNHFFSMKFTTLRPDKVWTPAQAVTMDVIQDFTEFGPSRGQVADPVSAQTQQARYDLSGRMHPQAIEDYTLSGVNWDGAWPQSTADDLVLDFRNFRARHRIDLFARKTVDLHYYLQLETGPYPSLLSAKPDRLLLDPHLPRTLYCFQPALMYIYPAAWANIIIDAPRIDLVRVDWQKEWLPWLVLPAKQLVPIAWIPDNAQLLAIPGSEVDGLVQVDHDLLYLQGSALSSGTYVLRRAGTTLVETVTRLLFEDGIDRLLDTQTQLTLAEANLPITLVGPAILDRSNTKQLDFAGAYGMYYRELFCHIPFLIANALNSRGRFAAAQRWYHYIFNPTASEQINVTNVPPQDVPHRLLDRVWRYREFRGLDIARLRAIITDPTAIALYRKDPFNPWSIARHRISAFQKAIVMKYVDNLMDWADSLFSQFTMESVSEALMIYIMASDVLGKRPVALGDCGATVEPKTYEQIAPLISATSEILIELETWIGNERVGKALQPAAQQQTYVMDPMALRDALERHPIPSIATAAVDGDAVAEDNLFRGLGWADVNTTSWGPELGNSMIKTSDPVGGRSFGHARKDDFVDRVGRFGWQLMRQVTPVFCVPANTDLLDYWKRLEDRLYKIRHCMDIDGNRRELALFAPPIDPMQLARMRAAGLSLEDVLGAGNGNLPPYRFLHLVDRAKALASSLSGFGGALLSAMEKRDAEELNRLRLAQQVNLAQLTTHTHQLEIDAASQSFEAVSRQLEAATYRSDFYIGLIRTGRTNWEVLESGSRGLVSEIKGMEASLGFLAAIFGGVMQIGSPFAMKYGGQELHNAGQSFADATGTLSAIAEAVASAASLEAGFDRRIETWTNQKQLADYDVQSLQRQAEAAAIRLDIAKYALDLHQKGIDQTQEMLDLTDGKFTNHGLYVWLSTQLQRLYRATYQNALALGKLAEQAYRFERGDDNTPRLSTAYWDQSHAGLLAGESLLTDLQTLERRFLETDFRMLEINQAFSLSQIDPAALVSLRQTGGCTFTIPEPYFDLFYPGHYKRRIKAVRLTIPAVTGPYVNVSATLSLTRSWVRPTPQLGAPLVEVPPSRSVDIAASTAQNDAGVFELSFRDERYMPFEGLGAVSEWLLTLPKAFRQFDYQTIIDVIMSISYTAEQDSALRTRVEEQNAALEGSILHYFSHTAAHRLFSLRQDFSSAFTRLMQSASGTPVQIEIADRHFPLFLQGRRFQVQRGILLLRTAAGLMPTGVSIAIDGAVVNTFAADPTLGNVPGAALPGVFTTNLRAIHTVTIQAAGNLAPPPPPPGGATALDLAKTALDPAKLEDALVYLEYTLA